MLNKILVGTLSLVALFAIGGSVLFFTQPSAAQVETGVISAEQLPTDELNDSEIAALFFMREEEKLAHDVYVTLYDVWGQQIFLNISKSEQTHTDAVKRLLDQYGLPDPVDTNGVGVFTDSDLQALYDQLVEQGGQSLVDAFSVGAAIEEIDILDLEERIAQTENADIIQVYERLLNGSYNHLRAFVSNLERESGESYQPQYMSQTAYDAIINSTSETGHGQGNGSGSGHNGGQGNGSGNGHGGGQGNGSGNGHGGGQGNGSGNGHGGGQGNGSGNGHGGGQGNGSGNGHGGGQGNGSGNGRGNNG